MSIGLCVKIVLTAGMWDIFYFCKKNSKKRKKIFKYEKSFIKYAKLIFIFAILVSCIGLCFGKYCKYAKLIFKNAKSFSNMRNSISKTINLYSFLLNLCKLRRTYSVCVFRHYWIFSNMQNFSSKMKKRFSNMRYSISKMQFFLRFMRKMKLRKQHNRRRINLGILILGTTLFGFRLILFHHGTLI